MIDYPFRTGTRRNPGHTTPNAPSLDDAYTICVPGGDRESEHTQLHQALNPAVRGSGTNGLTTFGDVKRQSFASIDSLDEATLSAQCKQLYKALLSRQYAMPDSTPLRANPSPTPKPDNDVGKALSEAWGFKW